MGVERSRQLRKQMPASEASLWNALRSLKAVGLHFRRQVPLGRYHADFACFHPKLVIEVDGAMHSPERDAVRDAFMAAEGFKVLRVTNEQVRFERDGVIRAVLHAVGREY